MQYCMYSDRASTIYQLVFYVAWTVFVKLKSIICNIFYINKRKVTIRISNQEFQKRGKFIRVKNYTCHMFGFLIQFVISMQLYQNSTAWPYITR